MVSWAVAGAPPPPCITAGSVTGSLGHRLPLRSYPAEGEAEAHSHLFSTGVV